MNLHLRKGWATAIGAAVALSAVTGAGAYAIAAAAPEDLSWYSADEQTDQPDPDKVSGLTFYRSGVPVTSGDLDEPLADFVVADGELRDGDGFATLYAYGADGDLAPGAWTGSQISGTRAFPTTGLPTGVTVDDAVYQRGTGDTTLADLIEGYENLRFEIRLRTSSATAGVGTTYASQQVAIDGEAGTWSTTADPQPVETTTTLAAPATAPYGSAVNLTVGVSHAAAGTVEFLDGETSLGTRPVARGARGAALAVASPTVGAHSYRAVFTPTRSDVYAGSESAAVAVTVAKASSTVTATVPARSTYGKVVAVTATVQAAGGTPTGTVTVKLGGATLATGTLTGGTARLAVPATALAPGNRSLTVAYGGSATVAAASAARVVVVAKAAPGKPVLKVVKKPTRKKAGAATVTIGTGAGLAQTGGRATIVLTKGRTVKKVVVTIRSGKASVKLPKLPKGTWSVRVDYLGDANYLAARSGAVKVKTK